MVEHRYSPARTSEQTPTKLMKEAVVSVGDTFKHLHGSCGRCSPARPGVDRSRERALIEFHTLSYGTPAEPRSGRPDYGGARECREPSMLYQWTCY